MRYQCYDFLIKVTTVLNFCFIFLNKNIMKRLESLLSFVRDVFFLFSVILLRQYLLNNSLLFIIFIFDDWPS